MYQLYSDKKELFEANIELDGASLDETFARLVMNTDRWNLVFEGNIDANGNVEIPINKLKGILSDDTKGNLRLEVVADDTYFTPWEDNFELLRSKSVTVEVKESNKDKKLVEQNQPKVTVKEKKKKGWKLTESIAKSYLREIITEDYKSDKGVSKNKIREITTKFIKENKLNSTARKKLYSIVKEWSKGRK